MEIASQCGEFPAAGLPGPNVARRTHGAAQVLSAPSSYLPHCRGGPVPAAAYITLCVREKVHILVRVKASALPPLAVLCCSAPRGSTEQNRAYLTALLSSDFFLAADHIFILFHRSCEFGFPSKTESQPISSVSTQQVSQMYFYHPDLTQLWIDSKFEPEIKMFAMSDDVLSQLHRRTQDSNSALD